MEETKKCTKCNEPRLISQFSIRRASPDGLAYKCKPCDSQMRKANRLENLEAQNETSRLWRIANPERKKQIDRALYERDCASGKRQAYRKAAYEENRVEILASQKKYRDENLELIRERKLLERLQHPERVLQRKRREYLRNKSAYIASANRRRALEIKATPAWADLPAIRKIYDECQRISEETGIPHEVDHDVPLQSKLVCGLHVEHNLKIITKVANRKKSNKFKIT